MRHALALLLLAACSASPALSPRDCTPGATLACACPGASGVQTCGAEGTLGACVCADAGAVVGAPVDVVAADAPPSRADASPVPVVAPDAPAPAMDAGSPQDAATAPDVVPVDVRAPCEPVNVCGNDCVTGFHMDPRHCGRCGNACPDAGPGTVPVCASSRCSYVCQVGFVPCGFGRCVDPYAPGFDCRRCDFQCPVPQTCRIINADRSECR